MARAYEEAPPELLTQDIKPPGAPTNVVAVLRIGCAEVSWAAPTDDGGQPIVHYTVTSQHFGEDKARRHEPPRTALVNAVQGAPPTTHAIGPYATNKRVTVACSPCLVEELAQGRVYAFHVHCSNGRFEGPRSGWSNRVRPQESELADVRQNMWRAQARTAAMVPGQTAYQGAYFLRKEEAWGWAADALAAVRGGDGEALIEAMLATGADVNAQCAYEREGVPRHERLFRLGGPDPLTGLWGVELGAFDCISDLDKMATTGDTLLHLAIKLGDRAVVRAALSCVPDLSVRNAKGKAPTDLAERAGMLKLLEMAAVPDPDREARVFGAWERIEDAASGTVYFWNTVTNATQFEPPADPSRKAKDSVHDTLTHSKAWKGW